MGETKTAREVWSMAEPKAYTIRELARRSASMAGNGLPLVSEKAMRAFTRRAENPLPSLRVGASDRPHVYVFEPVFLAFLLYLMGCCEYGEVDEAARFCVMGARP